VGECEGRERCWRREGKTSQETNNKQEGPTKKNNQKKNKTKQHHTKMTRQAELRELISREMQAYNMKYVSVGGRRHQQKQYAGIHMFTRNDMMYVRYMHIQKTVNRNRSSPKG
jgi:hypothetical protein